MRRRRCGCNGAERNRRFQGQFIRHKEVDAGQHQIYQQRCGQRLDDGNHRSLAAGLFQLRQAELVADCKRDKAQGHL